MSNADSMRGFMKLFEADYVGPQHNNPDVTYDTESKKGEITKVIATLTSDTSGKYTKLGRNLNRMIKLREAADRLEEQAKQQSREMVAELFHASDACRTREVDTVSFLFKITKDPEATTTVKYAKVLEELEKHLTPELITVLEALKTQFSSVTQKQPSLLKHVDKAKKTTEESIELSEGFWDTIKSKIKAFATKVMNWGKSYDSRLARLKAEVGMS